MLSDIYPELKKTVENPEQWVYEFHVLELRDIEINVEKIIAVTDTNYAELRKRAWKFRLAGIPTLTSGDKHSWSEWTNSVPELKLWNPFRVDNFFLFFFHLRKYKSVVHVLLLQTSFYCKMLYKKVSCDIICSSCWHLWYKQKQMQTQLSKRIKNVSGLSWEFTLSRRW